MDDLQQATKQFSVAKVRFYHEKGTGVESLIIFPYINGINYKEFFEA